MRVERYECDVCKTPSNGNVAAWYAVCALPSEVHVRTLAEAATSAIERDWRHACGEPCLLRLVADAARGLKR